jgi:hypothetical protein
MYYEVSKKRVQDLAKWGCTLLDFIRTAPRPGKKILSGKIYPFTVLATINREL